MKQCAFLLGAAKKDFRQKKLIEMHDSLVSDGGFSEREISIFPNSVSEIMFEFALNNAKSQGIEKILLYICTLSEISDDAKSVFLGDEEIRKSVISHYSQVFGDFRVVYDFCADCVRDL